LREPRTNAATDAARVGRTVIYGQAIESALAQATAHCQGPAAGAIDRWAIVTTRSLNGPGGAAARIREHLGSHCVGIVSDIAAHSPRQDVIRIARQLQAWGAQGVVAVGGGSVCDAVKAARLCLGNDVTQADDIDRLRLGHTVRPPRLHSIMVPTTLSAGEFTPYAGVNDERGPRHESLHHEALPPSAVILDPAMTIATPPRLWFGTALRAVDHAVETWCSPSATPFGDATSLHALKLLVPALRRCQNAPHDLAARSDCQVGAWLSIQGFASLGVCAMQRSRKTSSKTSRTRRCTIAASRQTREASRASSRSSRCSRPPGRPRGSFASLIGVRASGTLAARLTGGGCTLDLWVSLRHSCGCSSGEA
jgi:alcohol dehydrogenase class IV